jgi:hypothetical protein
MLHGFVATSRNDDGALQSVGSSVAARLHGVPKNSKQLAMKASRIDIAAEPYREDYSV